MFLKFALAIFAIFLFSNSLYANQTYYTDASKSLAGVPLLTGAQKQQILLIYQKEKLRRDVYITFATKYPNAMIFSNIARVIETHSNSIRNLCIKYNVDISAVNHSSVGNFVQPNLRAYYLRTITKGSLSLIEALKVSASLERENIIISNSLSVRQPIDVIKIIQIQKNNSKYYLSSFNSSLAKVK